MNSEIYVNTDTITDQKIIAKYHDNNVVCLLIITDSIGEKAIKINYSRSAPVISDSLIRARKNVFISRIYNHSYEVLDCEIKQNIIMKTVHPSSNWQGQTPGEKIITYTFKNIK
jgi:hypothetical protein